MMTVRLETAVPAPCTIHAKHSTWLVSAGAARRRSPMRTVLGHTLAALVALLRPV